VQACGFSEVWKVLPRVLFAGMKVLRGLGWFVAIFVRRHVDFKSFGVC